MTQPKLYYGAQEKNGRYFGIVYQYDASGEKTELVFKNLQSRDNPEMAIDDAAEYLDSEDLTAELD